MDILAFIRDEIINVDISLADADAVCGVSRRQTLRRRDRLIETPTSIAWLRAKSSRILFRFSCVPSFIHAQKNTREMSGCE
jgi:hypothetical protein